MPVRELAKGTLDRDELLALLEKQVDEKRTNRMKSFTPYPRQFDFFAMGKEKRERLLTAGNQVGKSEAGAFEAACHATGLYPEWWPGKRFNRPTTGWACGITGEQVRDVAQTKLFGIPGSEDDWGTGMVPKSALLGRTLGHGVSNFYDVVRVRHRSGGVSTIGQKAYSQGRAKFQGPTLDWIWEDEENEEDIHSECLARLRGDGILFTTFTPLKGITRLVRRFQERTVDAQRDRGVVRMGLRHAEHFTEEEKARRLAGYPAHERAARENGDPMLGSGAVFEDVTEKDISIDMHLSDAPDWWAKLWGIDFGGGGGSASHPFAAVLTAWDREADVIYVLDAFRMNTGLVMGHAARIKRTAPKVKVAWPHDGHVVERGSGEDLASLYRAEGLEMLPTHATHATGNFSTEAGIQEMLSRMRSGSFRVASHLHEWWEEFRTYHREDGKIVKLDDDLMSATRIAVMDRRRAAGGAYGGTADTATRVAAMNNPDQIQKRVEFDVWEPWGMEA